MKYMETECERNLPAAQMGTGPSSRLLHSWSLLLPWCQNRLALQQPSYLAAEKRLNSK